MSPGAPLREVGVIAFIAIAAFTLLALLSYSPMDPAWSLRGTGLSVNNLVGRSGAWVADVLFSLFGVIGYVVPFALLFGGLRTMRLAQWDWPLESPLKLRAGAAGPTGRPRAPRWPVRSTARSG